MSVAVILAVVLAACAFAYAIGSTFAGDGGRAAAATTTAQPSGPDPRFAQDDQAAPDGARPDRDDCPEKDGGGGSGDSGSDDAGSSGSSEDDAPTGFSY